jgi:hypothetical protein
MPSVAQSLYLFVTLLGGVAVPLLFFVAVKRAVDCAFAYLESLGLWEAAAGSGEGVAQEATTADVVGGHRQPNVLVDGIILTGSDQAASLGSAAIGCTDPDEPQLRSLHRCTAAREPMRDAPRKGANHVTVLQHGDLFEVLQTITDISGTDRSCVRLHSSGNVGWIRSSTAISCAHGTMQPTSETARQVHGAVVDFTPVPPVTGAAEPREATAGPAPGSGDTDGSRSHSRHTSSNEVVAVEQWFARRGVTEATVVSGACAALSSAGYPPRRWQSELLALEAEDELQHWIALIRADAARTVAAVREDCAASHARDVDDV